MRFKDKIKLYGLFMGGCFTLALAYLGITVAVNTAMLPLQAGIEAALNQPKQEYRATLKEKKTALMLGTHGRIACGDFELQDGTEKTVCDYASVLEGKIFANKYIPGMEEGKTYDMVVKGSEGLGYTIVDLVEEQK